MKHDFFIEPPESIEVPKEKKRKPRKIKKKDKTKPPYSSKEDEYKAQKPCCRSNGKVGH